MSESKPFIEIDRGPWRPQLQFYSPENLAEFLDREEITWSWTTSDTIPGGFPNEFRNRYHGWIQPFRDLLQQWRSHPDNQDTISSLTSMLTDRFLDHNCLSAVDAAGQSLAEIGKISPVAAAVALSVIFSGGNRLTENDLRRDAIRVGLAKGLAILAGIDTETPAASRDAFETAATRFAKRTADAERAIAEFKDEGKTALESARLNADNSARGSEANFTDQMGKWAADFEKIKADLAGITAAYENRMQLEGPVRYWTHRSRAHGASAARAFWWLIGYSIVATVVLSLIFHSAVLLLPPTIASNETWLLFKVAAFSLLMTTIAFWVGRVILRVYWSDRHLHTDAEERRTMVMTFLALIKKQAITDEDRKLILAALFRPGSDGIVKDEAAPDTALAALIGSLMKK